ncbi:MAG: carbohydrate ABC transporter substrate-binding protein [Synechococcales cyanobacterium C42_A2020_086]|nr:carbohydrate ABC transporter substrate-binding protein [Synechococcales cyanobacterium C42_A2020_086]
MMSRWRRRLIAGMLGLLVALLLSCHSEPIVNQTGDPGPAALRIYWNRGFYPEEDQALQQVIQDWEQQTGTRVELSLISSDDILNQTTIALENNAPPDIVFAHRADYTLQPRWALEGKLMDVSEVIEPVRDRYSPAALESAYLYDKTIQQRRYYGVPIELQTIHIHYWRDLLTQANLQETDIPNDWDGFWNIWKQGQKQLRQKGKEELYGLGLPLSTKASDTFFLFEQILEAYDIELLDAEGKLRLSDPAVRQGVIDSLTWLTQFYQTGYVPTSALNWVDSDNNVNFLNRVTLMTANPSLAIPASQRGDEAVYQEQIVTREFPLEPDGEPIRYLTSIKQALIFKNSPNPNAAKQFLAYLIQPDRLNQYIKGSLGRWFPVMPDLLKDAFWQDARDPHVSKAVQQLMQHPTRLFYHVLNPAYSQVQSENIWGQAIHRVIVEGQSPEMVVDEAIQHINRIAAEWER